MKTLRREFLKSCFDRAKMKNRTFALKTLFGIGLVVAIFFIRGPLFPFLLESPEAALDSSRLDQSEVPIFHALWPKGVERTWIGPEYWANRLQDWRIRDGRLEGRTAAANRNVHILTRALGDGPGTFDLAVRFGVSALAGPQKSRNWAGFKIGVRGEFNDYRDSAIYGKGLNAGLTSEGALMIGDLEGLESDSVRTGLMRIFISGTDLILRAEPSVDAYKVTIMAVDPATKTVVASLSQSGVSADSLRGGLALVGHLPDFKTPESGAVVWFEDWKIGGPKVEAREDRAFGPVLFAQYTLSRGVLKLAAQMPPVGEKDGRTVRLQVKDDAGTWKDVGEAPIDPDARTATFKITGWKAANDMPYRLLYDFSSGSDGAPAPNEFLGTIRREPNDKKQIVLAAFTGNNDLGFPQNEIVAHVRAHNPDLLFFSGDQIYESVGGYGVQTEPVEAAVLDYLRKWYLFGWAFRDILRDRPSVAVPDDHDVYHGNLWGAGGKATPAGLTGMEAQDAGGYKMLARWVNMVQRTQTSHLPDPVDPAPVEQGIGVYFCDLDYAGVSFAVLEDRKFKSAPKPLLPKAEVRNGWAQNLEFDAPKEADVPGAELLGERQLKFLKSWAADWSNGIWMKAVLSQTLFATVATLPASERSDANVPRLSILKSGEYPPDDLPVADMDSNGWPQSGRNAAVREMRKAFAVHIAGDQHLGSTIQYGLDAWRDAGFALCVPSISNYWPRRWFPKTPGANRKPGDPLYSGDYKDGFGNRMTVRAVVNPFVSGRLPENLYDRAAGYGIARFDRATRQVILECWPRWAGPDAPGTAPYPGWPILVRQSENYGRKPTAYLPLLKFKGMTDPVVQIIREADGEIIYTLRIKGDSFRPMVFASGFYTVLAGEPGTTQWKLRRRIGAGAKASKQTVTIDLTPLRGNPKKTVR